ncbi:uncharacterized protein MELLADRAFT_63395 [Melampsora larici-populina 98AG31]|uniref:F-box domain-containing protein n=1 Tax=Melampsora larici-populina (strain 98AG31 / pathotype 3-4-7) TaxID=747676 RepID=F4RMH8_MELLP|nr:uncharacterized protein MELLADRAFT_63395 [Melampsora larici-populina 98AG31]EGG06429.1 hypothetical protein MELLADRAFT_63395 [Melampsora larici-populina 98AG31]
MENTINQITSLPYEILVMILREFVNQINARNDSSRRWSDTEKLQKKPSMRDLINLRLVRLSNRFIKVSQPILKSLKSLKLSVHRRPDFEYSNLTSITRFLHNLPQLESLTLFSVLFDSSVIIGFGSQESKPIGLTNLQHFSFVLFETNYELISQFTKSSKNTLKTIRLLSCSSSDEAIEKVLSPIKDTLEGIFTSSFTDEIIGNVIQWSFPNLRVIGTHHHPRWICEKLHWLQVEMLRYVRTIVIDLDGGEEYWSESFSVMEPDVLKNVPNLKLIVFCDRYEESEVQFIDPDLVESFREHGIQCHLIDKLVPDEIMELDYKLNGPMLK